MSLIGPSLDDIASGRITKAGYTHTGQECDCICHRHPNVLHCMPCCYPEPPKEVSYYANPFITDETKQAEWIAAAIERALKNAKS